MTVRVRFASAADAEAIAFLHWQGWRTAYAGFIPAEIIARRGLVQRVAEWRERLGPSPASTFMAGQDGIARGFVHACRPRTVPLRPAPDGDWQLEIGYLYVDPQAQGLGLGRALLRAVAVEAARAGLHRCVVVAFAGNPSRHAYERLGARVIRTEDFVLEGWAGQDVYYAWQDFPAAFGIGSPGAGIQP